MRRNKRQTIYSFYLSSERPSSRRLPQFFDEIEIVAQERS